MSSFFILVSDAMAVFIICFFIAGGNIRPSRKEPVKNMGMIEDGKGEE
jgi:hypothetical protein